MASNIFNDLSNIKPRAIKEMAFYQTIRMERILSGKQLCGLMEKVEGFGLPTGPEHPDEGVRANMLRFRQILNWASSNRQKFNAQNSLERIELELELRSTFDGVSPDLALFAGFGRSFQPIVSADEAGIIWAGTMNKEYLSWLHSTDRICETVIPPTYPENFDGFGFRLTLECAFAPAKQDYIDRLIDPDPGQLLAEPVSDEITADSINQL